MNGIIEMLKDPKTQEIIAGILTQMIAFLIFLFILKKFAWGPILRLLDERRNKIASEFERISGLEQQYSDLKNSYEQKLSQIEQEARIKLQAAVDEGRLYAKEIVDNARKEYQARIDKAEQDIKIEVEKSKRELKKYIIDMSLDATERLLYEKLDETKHKAMLAKFISEIEKEN